MFLADVDNDTDNDIAVGYFDGYGPNKIFLNQTITGIDDVSFNPTKFNLFQNYPNPFNPTTKISYQIFKRGFVSLKIFDVLGNEIATLVSEEKTAGEYEVNFSGLSLSTGIYFYRLQSGGYSITKKMTLVK